MTYIENPLSKYYRNELSLENFINYTKNMNMEIAKPDQLKKFLLNKFQISIQADDEGVSEKTIIRKTQELLEVL